jgi:exodeoxyribonuclease V gamma subunit
VVVLSPDIEEYAPYIQAVFGTASSEQHIPWSIADQSLQAEHPLLGLFIELLGLFKSRFNVSQVLNLLENPALQARLQIDEDGLETLRHWIHNSGIRWGFDEQSRADEGLPGFEQNSWQFGLRRMMLGYALPAQEGSYRAYTPYSPVFGQQAVLLGKLQGFIHKLQHYQNQFSKSYSLLQWTQQLQQLVDDFFQAGDEEERNALQVIRDRCSSLNEESQLADFAETLSLDVVIQELQAQLSQAGANHRFMTGQVTFCTMVPMRSIPYQVVCLLGMGDQYYPRRVKQVNFDLMQHDVRKGDRSRREDDRYLFLESLLAARQIFYISYVGRSLQDNAPYLPSVVVDELLDYINRHYRSSHAELIKQISTEHPMQPFSSQYTEADNPRFTYQAQWFGDVQQPQPFVFMDQPLPATEFGPEHVALEDLISFFSDPIRWTLQQRLQLRMHATRDELDDHEPFSGDSLLRYQVSQPLLQRLLRGQPAEAYMHAMQHSGKLPMGMLGERLLQGWQQEMQTLVAQIQDQLPQIHYEPRELDVAIGDTRVQGWLDQYGDSGVVRVRAANLNAKDRLSLWLEHLLWCSAAGSNDQNTPRALGFARDHQYRFQAVENAPEILGDLLQLYRRGQSEILHFYPKTSYLQAVGEKLEKVQQSWMNFDFTRQSQGEGQRLDYQMALAGHEPLDEQFVELAQRIYQPLIDHLQEEKL